MTSCGAVALRALIGLFHNALYNGTFSIWYDANVSEGPSRFSDWVILLPVLGGLVVVFLVQRFAPEAKGHGVPEVMDAVFYKRGNIRGQVAIVKSLASALSIGSGAAVGREGPIIQIGSALGSAFSQAIRSVDMAENHLALRWSRRRDRRDLQHAARWRIICSGNPVARGFQPNFPPRRGRDGGCDDHRQNTDRA